MENQAVIGGEFYGDVVLQESPRVEDVGEIVDAYEVPISGELAYPKLDGILFPVVVANADVVAPCRWMGGAEVSLTVALNNYYQAMTEENADEVIADVYDFLANQIQPVEVIEEVKTEKEEEADQPQTVPPEKTISEKPFIETPPVARIEPNDRRPGREDVASSRTSQFRSEPEVDDAVLGKDSISQKKPANSEKKTAAQSIPTAMEKVDDVSRPGEAASKATLVRPDKEKVNSGQSPLEIPEADNITLESEPAVALQPVNEREPATGKINDSITPSENEVTLSEAEAPPNEEVSYVVNELPPQNPGVDDAFIQSDVLPLEMEMDEPEDDYLGDLTEAPFSYDYDDQENPEELDNMIGEGMMEGSGTGVWDETAKNLVEAPGETIENTRGALNDSVNLSEADDLHAYEAMSMIESTIAELSRELKDYESLAAEFNQTDADELQKMLTKLLDDIELTHERALSNVEEQLNMKRYLDGETAEEANEMMRVPTLYNRVKGLLFVVSALIKRVSLHAVLVGRSVLRLHTFDYKGDYQRIVSYN